ncbi:MAG TPA: hypothetical protein VMD30_14065 [Tepidisphaeraceae bacterium]|nr:hypothetical protein [Tepidisphaeraceae bacterium]
MTAIQAPPQAPESPAVVGVRLFCCVCHHDLLNLPLNAFCPSCGTPVRSTYRADLLRLCDPKWLGVLRMGIYGILSATAARFLVWIYICAAAAAREMLDPKTICWVTLAINLLAIIGCWLLTSPDPSGMGDSQYGTSRATVRLSLLFLIGEQPFSFAMTGATLNALHLQSPAMATMTEFVQVFVALIVAIGFIAMSHYLGKTALRLPDLKLAAFARWIFWGESGLMCGFFLIALPLIPGDLTRPPALAACPPGLVFLLYLLMIGVAVVFVMLVVLLVRMLIALNQTIPQARQRTATPPPVPA